MSKTTEEAMTFLRAQSASRTTQWGALCLKLQRTARGLPAMYPSAISAQTATPTEHRFREISKIRRGMVCYFDTVGDSNPYGHITAVAGRASDGELLHWTNDVPSRGRVSLVRHSYFERYWGDKFQFASDWLNGYELSLPQKKPDPQAPKPALGKNPLHLMDAIESLSKAAAYHRKKNHPVLVKALERDIAHLKKILEDFS